MHGYATAAKTLRSPWALFVHHLLDAVSAAHIVAGQMEPRPATLGARGDRPWRDETGKQIRYHEQIFDRLGDGLEPTTCHAVEGVRGEHAAIWPEA
mgnify:CR=1 FL=1